MDEATSSMDVGTDDLIQKIIRREMTHCTIITIAHRLNTVIDYDRIMVLDDGKVVEMGSTTVLLNNKLSYFYKLFHCMS